jgi:hypothetical protein
MTDSPLGNIAPLLEHSGHDMDYVADSAYSGYAQNADFD